MMAVSIVFAQIVVVTIFPVFEVTGEEAQCARQDIAHRSRHVDLPRRARKQGRATPRNGDGTPVLVLTAVVPARSEIVQRSLG
jgi:hypothetical protein